MGKSTILLQQDIQFNITNCSKTNNIFTEDVGGPLAQLNICTHLHTANITEITKSGQTMFTDEMNSSI